MSTERPVVLTIAGSDSSGGAGIQRDLRVIEALGGRGLSVITAVTAQSERRVAHVHPVPVESLRAQLRVVFEDYRVDAVKIGMLGTAAAVEVVAEELARLDPRPAIVLDPVMVSSSGRPLLEEAAIEALVGNLVPLCSLVTPNVHETQTLGRLPVPALHTGGDAAGDEVVDRLVSPSGTEQQFRSPRLPGGPVHGTGCTLSSAIAVHLARGVPLKPAVQAGIRYTRRVIEETHDVDMAGRDPGVRPRD